MTRGVLTCIVLACLACRPRHEGTKDPEADTRDLPNPALADGRVRVDPNDWPTMSDYLVLLSQSPRTYDLSVLDVGLSTHLGGAPEGGPLANPMWILTGSADDLAVVEQTWPKHVLTTVGEADQAFSSADFQRALERYGAALAAAPGHPKLMVYLANTHFALGDYAQAAKLFEEALRVNPIDYQTHFFLADAYAQLGQPDAALRSIVWAHIFNPNHEAIRARLDEYAAALGKRIDHRRLSFPYRVEPKLRGGATIVVANESPELVALATCEALWLAEPELVGLFPDDFGIHRVEACLVAAGGLVYAAEQERQRVSAQGHWLSTTIAAGHLDAILIWEYLGHRQPEVIPLMGPEFLARVEAYWFSSVLQDRVGTSVAQMSSSSASAARSMMN